MGYCSWVPVFVLRVWLPDRPGALGAVASRIGAVKGDLIGIDILERGGGRAIDELTVALADERLLSLLVEEVSEVDGVDVEDVRSASREPKDAALEALETARLLMLSPSPGELLTVLVDRTRTGFGADWASVVRTDQDADLLPVSSGQAPPVQWLSAFVAGSRSADASLQQWHNGPPDVAWAMLEPARAAVVLGRGGQPFRVRERHQLAAITDLASVRWSEIRSSGSRRLHPSAC